MTEPTTAFLLRDLLREEAWQGRWDACAGKYRNPLPLAEHTGMVLADALERDGYVLILVRLACEHRSKHGVFDCSAPKEEGYKVCEEHVDKAAVDDADGGRE